MSRDSVDTTSDEDEKRAGASDQESTTAAGSSFRAVENSAAGMPRIPMGLHSEPHRPKRALAGAVAWTATVSLLCIALLRVFFHDGTYLLTCVNAFTRYVYLPAYVGLAYALWERRRTLAIVNLAVIAGHIFWIAPDFTRDCRFDSVAERTTKSGDNASQVRILFANVRYVNAEFATFLSEIDSVNPDVVILVEFPWTWREPFLRSPVIAKYRYGHGYMPWRNEQVIVYSKLPLNSESERIMEGRTVESLDIKLGAQSIHLIGLHAPRPTSFRDDDYTGYWNKVEPFILSSPHPLVIVGDFNATQYSRVYKELKDSGLRSAHEDRGRGYATTWPNGMAPVPPIRIDQAFLSSDVACRSIAEGIGVGSDHKPLILDVEVQTDAASRAQSGG